MVGGIYWENPYAERLIIMRTYWKYNHLHAHRLILHRFVQKKKMLFFLLACEKTSAPDIGCTSLRGKPRSPNLPAFFTITF